MPKGSIPKTTINLKMNSAVDDFDRMDGLGHGAAAKPLVFGCN
jgi:hypothetical protein